MKLTRGQIIAFFFCLIPLLSAITSWGFGKLSANPIQDLTLRSGQAAIHFLLVSLACTPLRNIFHLNSLMPVRKVLGLAAFFYAVLHFLIFAGLDFEFNPLWIMTELAQKVFLRLGLIALLLMLPLAVTSLRKLQARLGSRWGRLHRLVYALTVLALAHFYLAAKGDVLLPLISTFIFLVLMLLRIPPLSKISISSIPGWLRKIDRYLLQ